jgi:alkanesulfonate monooxygenase SsuD/methylene tetrahydromethanopterin reductase-like flavin-dependent oxidoreductase (luciferase family)
LASQPVRYGLYLPPFGPFGDPGVLVDLARRAEAAGWDGVFLWDHLVTDAMPIADPWTTLGAISQVTERILIGTMVTPLARRRPWVVARHGSALSRLSGGRFVLGTGLGSDESGDFSRFGEPGDRREWASRYDEGLEIVRSMWSGRAFQHDGPHYRLDVAAAPAEPHPIPIWAACSILDRPAVIRRAAGVDGIFPNPENRRLTADDLAAVVAAVRDTGLVGERRFEVAAAGNASPAWEEPPTVDLPGLIGAGLTWWMESLIHFDPLELSLKIVDAGPPRVQR